MPRPTEDVAAAAVVAPVRPDAASVDDRRGPVREKKQPVKIKQEPVVPDVPPPQVAAPVVAEHPEVTAVARPEESYVSVLKPVRRIL